MLLKAHQFSKRWSVLFLARFVFNQLAVVLFCSLHRTLNLFCVYTRLDFCVRVRVRMRLFIRSILFNVVAVAVWSSITINAILIPRKRWKL